MIGYRDGHQILTCDGCFQPITKDEKASGVTTDDGREGHVCSGACGTKFNDKRPLDFRGMSLEERKAHAAEALEQ